MEKPFNYDQTLKIELLNEFSNGVYARLVNFVLKNGIDQNDDSNFYIELLNEVSEKLDLNLFELTEQELDDVKVYWERKNIIIKDITEDKALG